jgi:hypothetical protein
MIAHRKEDRLRNRVNKYLRTLSYTTDTEELVRDCWNEIERMRANLEEEKRKVFAEGFSKGVAEGERREALRRGEKR